MEVSEPKQHTEFEVQAFLWASLRALGINARGEVKTSYPAERGRKSTCRFDIAIFDGGKLVEIIEVKAAPMTHKRDGGWMGTRQGLRYSRFGVPVHIVYGMQQAIDFVNRRGAA